MGPREIIVIALVIVLLFGARKLPELARSVGRSMRIFKSEVNEMNAENNKGEISSKKQSEEEFWNSPEMQPGSTQAAQNQAAPNQADQQKQAGPQQ
ncbi:Sec-independent protein translocase subunit TatA [Corynebacterium sp.]|uniref:Sec-independent protein translocase subunit TatA n=1 Tax=Corynebacterium sp. TaxID=1720 RepID=UPI0026DB07DD|nr:Sec-independent protein translocase subunit TatA [Corynebacterium sp.]MDO5031596.1 Sec-independent protein translocase subunit TatA [Corynebacterium sp.]